MNVTGLSMLVTFRFIRDSETDLFCNAVFICVAIVLSVSGACPPVFERIALPIAVNLSISSIS